MRMKDYITLGWDQLRRRKVVTALCALGIAIGCASIIVALSFGESLNYYSQQSMNQWFSMDELNVSSGYLPPTQDQDQGKPVNVTSSMLELIRTFPGVQAAAPFQYFDFTQFIVDETRHGYLELNTTHLESLQAFGHELRQGAVSSTDNTVVLSYGATFDIYDERASLVLQSQQNQINQQDLPLISYPLYQKVLNLQKHIPQSDGTTKTITYPLKVIGIIAAPEGVSVNRLRNQKTAYISAETAKLIRAAFAQSGDMTESAQQDSFNNAVVKVTDQASIPKVEAMIKKLNLHVDSNLFQLDRINDEMIIIRLVFGGIGLFILFVASLTIIVAMTMATHQRRRQIGIMKVLGANLSQIRNMFIFEATLLGILGGLLGILISYWVIWGINAVIIYFSGQGSDIEIMFISGWILPLGMLFAIMTGVLSGLYPAIKASRTDALTAIKRE